MSNDGSDSTMYYPSDMLHDYKNIAVMLGGEVVKVSVNRYRNANHTLDKGGTQEAWIVKEALRQLDSAAILHRAGGAQKFVDVFTGKGSVAAIRDVMLIFYDYSDRFIQKYSKSSGPSKQCAALLADEDLSWQETLQAISDHYIGLDCNGFVDNWMMIADPSLKYRLNDAPKDYYNRRKQTRKTVETIEYADVVVWANFSHIAVIDRPSVSGAGRFNMCQSAGGGPRMNEYQITVSSPGKFRLSGGIPAKDVPGEVYIVSPWPAP